MVWRGLSKSRYTDGIKCEKLLWLRFNDPDKVPPVSMEAKYVFDQGHQVDEIARLRHSDGIEVPYRNIKHNCEETIRLLGKGVPLFEAGFLSGDLYVRLDVLLPVGDGSWDIIEVKSGSSTKDQYYDDVAFQLYCCRKAGLNIHRCYLQHINREYVRGPALDPFEFFVRDDVTETVEAMQADIPDRVEKMLQLSARTEPPEVRIDQCCNKPYECLVKPDCWKHIPEHSVFELYRLFDTKRFKCYHDGCVLITDLPKDFKLSATQRIQVEAIKNCQPHINREAIRDFLVRLRYPLVYMDFETIFPAIPLYEGMQPYDHLPFQFSVHVQEHAGAPLFAHGYLCKEARDCRREFAEALLACTVGNGGIVVYNKGFEVEKLKALAEYLPEHAKAIEQRIARVVDLMVPFGSFDYYHPRQRGKVSIKKVLPALTGVSYENMDISGGAAACVQYFYATYLKQQFDPAQVYPALEKYCSLDTEGMALIVDKLWELVS